MKLKVTSAELVRKFSATYGPLLGKTNLKHLTSAILSVGILFTLLIGTSNLEGSVGTAMLTQDAGQPESVVLDSTRIKADSAVVENSPTISKFTGRVGIVDAHRLPLPNTATLKTLDTETLWLARVIYSETKRPEEQELVAWVVRNRVETRYRGRDTYQEVVLDPHQFSAFIPGTPTRKFYANLTAFSSSPGWKRAIAIARIVRELPETYRPFSIKTRHFYSEQSMVGEREPAWAKGFEEVKPNREFELNARRFRFFEGIS